MQPTIKVRPIIKIYPKTEHLVQITYELNASEIFTAIEQAVKEGSSIEDPIQKHFVDYTTPLDCGFACEGGNFVLLTNDELKEILVQGAARGSLKLFLSTKIFSALRDVRLLLSQSPNFSQDFPKDKIPEAKEDLIEELSQKPESLVDIDPSLALEFAKGSCIDLGYLRKANRYLPTGPEGDYFELIFDLDKLKSLLPSSKIQFWQIYPSSISNDVESEPGIEFFLVGSSKIANNVCILNLREKETLKILEAYVEQNQGSKEEFEILALTRRISSGFLRRDGRVEKFEVRWPNSQKELAEKFGQAKKTKFETLKYGLSLLDRLEPTKELIKLFVGKKIYLYLTGWELPFIGIPIEKNALEVLILHLKLEYFQGTAAICQVQEEITDEVLALIWERAESNRIGYARLSGTQLTD